MKNKTDQILLALFEIGAFALVAIGLRAVFPELFLAIVFVLAFVFTWFFDALWRYRVLYPEEGVFQAIFLWGWGLACCFSAFLGAYGVYAFTITDSPSYVLPYAGLVFVSLLATRPFLLWRLYPLKMK